MRWQFSNNAVMFDTEVNDRSGISSTTEERRPELYVECALYIDGAPFGLPMRTRFHNL